jgi:ribosomal protein L7Ae-like RNA K-turn-binding protein
VTPDAAEGAGQFERRVLGLLGLGIRGRLAIVGVDQVREAARAGTLKVAVLAQDASHHSLEKVGRLLVAKGVPTISVSSARALGEVAGRESTAVIGVVDAQLAKGIRALSDPEDAVRSGSRRKG